MKRKVTKVTKIYEFNDKEGAEVEVNDRKNKENYRLHLRTNREAFNWVLNEFVKVEE